LRKKFCLSGALGGCLKDVNKGFSNAFSFGLRIRDALEFLQEKAGGFLIDELNFKIPAKDLAHHLSLPCAEHTVVDEDAGELFSDGAVEECRRHAGIHATGQAKDNVLIADLLPDILHGLVDVTAHIPFAPASGDLVDKVLDDLHAPGCVGDLGMKLQSEKIPLSILNGGVGRIFRNGHCFEAGWKSGEFVTMRVPDLQFAWQFVKESTTAILHAQRAFSVLALLAGLNLALEVFGHQLQAVADAEDGHAKLKDPSVGQGSLAGINALWTAGKNEGLGVERGNFISRRIVFQDCRVNLALTDASRNHLRVLRTKIQDNYLLAHWESGERAAGATLWPVKIIHDFRALTWAAGASRLSGNRMLDVIEKLLILRDRDKVILEIEAELLGLTTERAATQTRTADAESGLAEGKDKANHIESDRKQLENDAALQQQAKEKYLGQQMQTKDNVEYQAFGRQIKTCEKKISEIEDQELELMMGADSQAEVVAVAEAVLAEAQKDLDAAMVAIDEREKNLQVRLDETNALREEVAGQIDEETLDKYGRLFAKKGPSAVSGIEHAVCGHCHMKLPPQVIVDCKHGERVNFCPHCGVILYFTSNMVLEVAVDD